MLVHQPATVLAQVSIRLRGVPRIVSLAVRRGGARLTAVVRWWSLVARALPLRRPVATGARGGPPGETLRPPDAPDPTEICDEKSPVTLAPLWRSHGQPLVSARSCHREAPMALHR